jgi:hypothetical protein
VKTNEALEFAIARLEAQSPKSDVLFREMKADVRNLEKILEANEQGHAVWCDMLVNAGIKVSAKLHYLGIKLKGIK